MCLNWDHVKNEKNTKASRTVLISKTKDFNSERIISQNQQSKNRQENTEVIISDSPREISPCSLWKGKCSN